MEVSENVRFFEGEGGTVLARINGRVAFIHHSYTGYLPRPGELWRVSVVSSAPSKKNPDREVFFVRPVARITKGQAFQASEYDGIIREVTTNPNVYDICLAGIRAGVVAPNAMRLKQWLRWLRLQDARRRELAIAHSALARGLSRRYSFKILHEVATASGEYAFITHEQYRAFWAPQKEGEWLIVMTAVTCGYALSEDCAGWYRMPIVEDALPAALSINWNPDETTRRLAEA